MYFDMNQIIVVNKFLMKKCRDVKKSFFSLEMTYMFESPTYHRIVMAKDIAIRYPRYRLYSYCEGVRCEAHRRNQFAGIINLVFIVFKKKTKGNIFPYFHRFSCIVYCG